MPSSSLTWPCTALHLPLHALPLFAVCRGASLSIHRAGTSGHSACVQYNCEDIADDAMFQLATNNFIAAGGDGYEVFATLPRVLLFGPSLADALADYIDDNTPEGGVVRRPCSFGT